MSIHEDMQPNLINKKTLQYINGSTCGHSCKTRKMEKPSLLIEKSQGKNRSVYPINLK